MANVDDVEVLAGASDINEVACTVASVLDDLPVLTDPERGIPYVLVEPYAQVTFYPDNDNAGAFIAEVYAGTGAAVRREIALGIFDALSKRTRWDLRLTSDDQPGDGVVAERFASAVGPSAP